MSNKLWTFLFQNPLDVPLSGALSNIFTIMLYQNLGWAIFNPKYYDKVTKCTSNLIQERTRLIFLVCWGALVIFYQFSWVEFIGIIYWRSDSLWFRFQSQQTFSNSIILKTKIRPLHFGSCFQRTPQKQKLQKWPRRYRSCQSILNILRFYSRIYWSWTSLQFLSDCSSWWLSIIIFFQSIKFSCSCI